jgi:hypothetical protein
MTFKLLDYETMNSFKKVIEDSKVSERARKPDGFYTVYLREKGDPIKLDKLQYPNKKHSYLVERTNYLKRSVPQYQKNPTRRRLLSLISWAFSGA